MNYFAHIRSSNEHIQIIIFAFFYLFERFINHISRNCDAGHLRDGSFEVFFYGHLSADDFFPFPAPFQFAQLA